MNADDLTTLALALTPPRGMLGVTLHRGGWERSARRRDDLVHAFAADAERILANRCGARQALRITLADYEQAGATTKAWNRLCEAADALWALAC